MHPCASVQFALPGTATWLKKELDRLEAELDKRTVEYVSTENLYRLLALVRAEIRKVCQAPLPVEDAMAAEE